MSVVDLSKKISKYNKGWLAITPDNKKVVAFADSIDQVLKKARANGVQDPTLLKVPVAKHYFIGSNYEF